MYASWLKRSAPALRVIILERHHSPRHKIGESTLSGYCKAMRAQGISHRAMQRLFFPKNGLGFFYGTRYQGELVDSPEYIIEAFDETFQVERRPLEILLMENAKRYGVELVLGAKVDVKASTFAKTGCTLRYSLNDESATLDARLVVDASGPASVLARHFDLYNEGSMVSGFQTHSVWAYFKNVKWLDDYQGWQKNAMHPRDQYTQHVYFREGWMWYIPIRSWQHVPDSVMSELSRRIIADGDAPFTDPRNPSREVTFEQIWSIGLVIREDRDIALKHGPAATFAHYAREVPLIAKVLEGAEMIDGHYNGHNPYGIRRNIHHYCKQAAGDGWLLLGDAAFFVDPLASPGLTGGVAASYLAHQLTLKALERNDMSRESFAEYDTLCRELYQALEREIENIYLGFNHPKSLEVVMRLQEIDGRRHFATHAEKEYGIDDFNVWGILYPEYQELQKGAWNLMREGEKEAALSTPIGEQDYQQYENNAEQLSEFLGPYISEHIGLTPYCENNRGANLHPES